MLSAEPLRTPTIRVALILLSVALSGCIAQIEQMTVSGAREADVFPPVFEISDATKVTKGQQADDTQVIGRHRKAVVAIAISRDGSKIASASRDQSVKIWDVFSRGLLWSLEGHKSGVTTVAISRDGRIAGSGDWDGRIILWDLVTGKPLRILRRHERGIAALTFSPDDTTLLSGSFDGTVRLWRVLDGKHRQINEGENHQPVRALAFAPDGRTFLSGWGYDKVRVWDVASGREIANLAGHDKPVLSIAISPDGRRAASGGMDGIVHIWDLDSKNKLQTLKKDARNVRSLAISLNGQFLATVAGNVVKLWDLESGEELGEYRKHEGAVLAAVFTPDGRSVVSAGEDRALKQWSIGPALQKGQLFEIKVASSEARIEGRVKDASKIITFLVDEKVVELGSGGKFHYTKLVPQHQTLVRMKAEDEWGNVADGRIIIQKTGKPSSFPSSPFRRQVACKVQPKTDIASMVGNTENAEDLPTIINIASPYGQQDFTDAIDRLGSPYSFAETKEIRERMQHAAKIRKDRWYAKRDELARLMRIRQNAHKKSSDKVGNILNQLTRIRGDIDEKRLQLERVKERDEDFKRQISEASEWWIVVPFDVTFPSTLRPADALKTIELQELKRLIEFGRGVGIDAVTLVKNRQIARWNVDASVSGRLIPTSIEIQHPRSSADQGRLRRRVFIRTYRVMPLLVGVNLTQAGVQTMPKSLLLNDKPKPLTRSQSVDRLFSDFPSDKLQNSKALIVEASQHNQNQEQEVKRLIEEWSGLRSTVSQGGLDDAIAGATEQLGQLETIVQTSTLHADEARKEWIRARTTFEDHLAQQKEFLTKRGEYNLVEDTPRQAALKLALELFDVLQNQASEYELSAKVTMELGVVIKRSTKRDDVRLQLANLMLLPIGMGVTNGKEEIRVTLMGTYCVLRYRQKVSDILNDRFHGEVLVKRGTNKPDLTLLRLLQNVGTGS